MDSNETLSARAAEEIRAMLARRRITGRELARRLGVSQPWVSGRLTGATEIGLNDLEKIAAALDVQVAALLPITADRSRGVDRIAYPAQPERSAPRATRLLLAQPHVAPAASEQGADRATVRRPTIRAWRHEGVPA